MAEDRQPQTMTGPMRHGRQPNSEYEGLSDAEQRRLQRARRAKENDIDYRPGTRGGHKALRLSEPEQYGPPLPLISQLPLSQRPPMEHEEDPIVVPRTTCPACGGSGKVHLRSRIKELLSGFMVLEEHDQLETIVYAQYLQEKQKGRPKRM
jgi:hypothetical protein